MAIMRQKKRNIIIAAVAGFAAGVIPAGAAALLMTSRYMAIDNELSEAKENYRQYTGYVSCADKTRGDIIEESDLREVTFYSAAGLEQVDVTELAGKTLRQDTKEGIIITKAMVYEDTGVSDDLRMYMFDYIAVPEGTDRGTMFDIRISYPDGEDYIVAGGKHIEASSEDGVFINATEKELLMISSAYVDTTVYKGAKIYASIYVEDYQQLSVVNYPVNMYVTKLADWNPNLIKELEETQDAEKRRILEENLYEFMGVSMGNTYYEQ